MLLNELLKSQDLVIDERSIKGSIPFFRYIDHIEDKKYDIIIGAGHRTYSFLLDIKKNQKNETKTIAVLAPSIKRNKFDVICAPEHDKKKIGFLSYDLREHSVGYFLRDFIKNLKNKNYKPVAFNLFKGDMNNLFVSSLKNSFNEWYDVSDLNDKDLSELA